MFVLIINSSFYNNICNLQMKCVQKNLHLVLPDWHTYKLHKLADFRNLQG